jgi:hypothetical protein
VYQHTLRGLPQHGAPFRLPSAAAASIYPNLRSLAVGEALVTVDALHPRHIVIDPFQQQAFNNVGSDLLRSAGLDSITTLVATPSSIALAQLVTERVVPTRLSSMAVTGFTKSSSICISFERLSNRAV